MTPKRGALFLLLIFACAASAKHPDSGAGRPYFKKVAQKLMRKCQDMGYPEPKITMLSNVFNDSGQTQENRVSDEPNTFLSVFKGFLESVSPDKNPLSQIPNDDSMTKMNYTNLPSVIKKMRTHSESSSCYMRAFLAPLSWETVTAQTADNMNSEEYDTLLQAAKPALKDIPPTKLNLPFKVAPQRFKKMMKMLREAYESMSEEQRAQVVKWVKEKIMQNNFGCTTMPSSHSRSDSMPNCKSSLKWLNSDAMITMGPYMTYLRPDNVNLTSKEMLCKYFNSTQFQYTMKKATRMRPGLARRLLQLFQECFSEKEFINNVDRLGVLACYYDTVPDMTSELSRKLLSQLNDCKDIPKIKQLRKRLVESVMKKSNITEALGDLGDAVGLLSPKQLSMIPLNNLKEVYKNASIKWTRAQLRILVKKLMNKCKEISAKELLDIQSVLGGLPSCVFKRVKAQDILDNQDALRNISQRMTKRQLKAMLFALKDGDSSKLVEKLQGRLLRSLPLSKLAKANIPVEQMGKKEWSLPQALHLAKKVQNIENFPYSKIRKLRSVLQGFTCKIINKVADLDVQDTTAALAESPQYLSKVQARCAAQKLFATLEKEKNDYFKTITADVLDDIPTLLLLYLPPSKVEDLPDSVCAVLLDKMEMADLSLLPRRSPSRLAFTQRSLLCMGEDLSKLTSEDVSQLGPLVCELKPSQLRLLDPEVLNSTLQAMASCKHIPQPHRADLIQLVYQTFGDPSNWSNETMDQLGLFLLMDDNAIMALPNRPWMKDFLYYLKSGLSHVPDALKKKLFVLTTTSTLNTARKKRSATTDATGGTDSSTATVPTTEMIEGLGMDSVHYTSSQFEKMTLETFKDTIDILGNITDYSEAQLAVLIAKGVKVWGPVSNMNDSVLAQLGCISQGISNPDLEKLTFSLDTVEEIAACGWNYSQMEPMWKGIAKNNNLTVQNLGSVEIVALDCFICGLSSSEIQQLNLEAFKEAVDLIGGVTCSNHVTEQLKSVAVSAFGRPSTWTEDTVSDLGNIIVGLSANELASLDPSVFSFIKESSIPLIPPSSFASLSVEQLEELGPENAEMVTTVQKASLSHAQMVALKSAMVGACEVTRTSGQSGAPSLSVEGMSAFTKPLLFLFTGILLL